MLDLKKKVEQINLVLEKKKIPNIVCRVMGSLDASGSMEELYRNGTVQETINRLFALGYRFDDNQMIDLSLFSCDYINIGEIALGEVDNLVVTKIYKKAPFGGTEYANTIRSLSINSSNTVVGFFKSFFKKNENLPPAYAIVITDGDNSDILETNEELVNSLNKNIFFVFVGIGQRRYPNLEKYAQFNHVDFIKISDLNQTTDQELYSELLSTKFIQWMKDNHSVFIS